MGCQYHLIWTNNRNENNFAIWKLIEISRILGAKVHFLWKSVTFVFGNRHWHSWTFQPFYFFWSIIVPKYMEHKPITSTSANVTWRLVCPSRSKVRFTKLYVEPQEVLACEDKPKRALGRKLTFRQPPGQRRSEEVKNCDEKSCFP